MNLYPIMAKDTSPREFQHITDMLFKNDFNY